MVLAVLAVGPVSAATSKSHGNLVAQGASNTATVTGTITGAGGGPLAGAGVSLVGPATYRTTTDANGTFSITNVSPGYYSVSITHGGYQTAQSDFVLVAGQVQAVNVALQLASFSSLQTIAHVRAVGRGVFNTTTAAINTINSTQIQEQGAYDAFQLFDQVPGVQVNLASSSANGADPAAVSIPEIRGAFPYETAILVDGHPMANGGYGDYVTSYMYLPVFLQEYEVTKGPGALAPVLNNAIGGTINLVTYDPTLTFTPNYIFGIDNYSGTYALLGVSDTILNGRLGIVANIGSRTQNCACQGQSLWLGSESNDNMVISPGTANADEGYYNDTRANIPGTDSKVYNEYNLAECCFTVVGNTDTQTELVKLAYHFSSTTYVKASYLNSDFTADQNSATLAVTPSIFAPKGAYQGPLPNGNGQFLMSNIYPAPNTITDNEPLFEVDFGTSIGQDTFLARYYHASIIRTDVQGSGPNEPDDYNWTIYGYNDNYSTPYPTYNGVNENVASYEWFIEDEFDHLQGFEAQYTHPYGEGNSVVAAWNGDQTSSQYYELDTTMPGVCEVCTYNTPIGAATENQYAASIPQGSNTISNTYSLTDITHLAPNLVFDAAIYEDLYRNTYPLGCESSTGALETCTEYTGMNPNGSNAYWTTATPTHFDDRFGLEWRPDENVAIRFAAGSSIAPPYLDILSFYNTTPAYSSSSSEAIEQVSNPDLKPETAFGYDLGADIRVIDPVTYAKVDLYTTNLWNHFIEQYFQDGVCSAADCGSHSGVPVIAEEWVNLSNARMQGIELTLQRVPDYGWGYFASASIEHAYAYNLPANFYCGASKPATAGKQNPCTPAYYNTNLTIIPGANFTGNGVDTTDGQNGFGTGYSVPYLSGYGRINWTSPGGWFVQFGEQLTGKNNWANEPPFWVGTASLKIPLAQELSIQISGYNVFNTLSGLYPVVGGGVPLPLACTSVSYKSSTSSCDQGGTNGVAATEGNVLGPARWEFLLVKNFANGP